jgi:alpha-L-fucosidase
MDMEKKLEEQKDEKMVWWRKAKFGMFIHWGLYSLPAGMWNNNIVPEVGEWIQYHARIPIKEYKKLAKHFNPKKSRYEMDSYNCKTS